MKKIFRLSPSKTKLKYNQKSTLIILVIWFFLILVSALWNYQVQSRQVMDIAKTQAKAFLQKDLAFRKWAAQVGGFYVPVTDKTPPNPHMVIIPERDITTPSGKELTLYNPAIMLKILSETQDELFGIKTRITGEISFGAENAPDDWEKHALTVVKQSRSDYVDLYEKSGIEYLRMMQPMIMEPPCLKCHAWTKIPVGELRGATDVAIPLAPIKAAQQEYMTLSLISHFAIWLLGSLIIIIIGQKQRAAIKITKSQKDTIHKLSLAVEQSASGIIITDSHGIIEYVNQQFIQNSGFSWEELIGKKTSLWKSGQTPRSVYLNLWETIMAGKQWRGEILNRKKSGDLYWTFTSISPVKDVEGKVTHFSSVVEDISERKKSEATIERLALYDPLTDLANRRLLDSRASDAIDNYDKNKAKLAVFYIDLDNFKDINDTLGHLIGDQMLITISKRLKTCVRETDIVARLGGDEFAVILEDVKTKQAVLDIANNILTKIKQPVSLSGYDYSISCSLGICFYPEDGETTEQLFSNADIAMYHAKSLGRNGFQCFNQDLRLMNRRKLQLQRGLKKALENNEMHLLFQPKIDIITGKIYGVEALLRWDSPELGNVPPVEFIPVAEESKDIIPLGLWVIEQALKQAQIWQSAHGQLSLSVNLSAVQFQDSDLVDKIAQLLKVYHFTNELFELEITETALIKDADTALKSLTKIRNIGINISIDDFGTGHSSLSQLKTLPVDILKIDRAFIHNLSRESEDFTIVNSIISLGKSLNLNIIAEGVETPEQLQILTELNCDFVQGFLFSKAVCVDDLLKLVEKHNNHNVGIRRT